MRRGRGPVPETKGVTLTTLAIAGRDKGREGDSLFNGAAALNIVGLR